MSWLSYGNMERIGVDCDGCLVNFVKPFIAYLNDQLDTTFTYDDVVTYEFEDALGIDADVAVQKVQSFFKTPMFRALLPEPGAQEAIRKLRETAELIVVTARPLSIMQETYACLDAHFPGSFSEVYFSNGRYGNEKGATKSAICKELALGYMIEDSPIHAADCASVVKGSFLLERPWNRQANPEGVIRAKSWEDIIDHLYR